MNPTTKEISQKILNKVVEYYHKTFMEEQKIITHLITEFAITDKSCFTRYKIGYANGSLLKTIPQKGEIFESLKEAGVLNKDGSECFLDCVIIPEIDSEGNCLKLSGKKLLAIDKSDLAHILPKEIPSTPNQPDASQEQIECLKDGLFIRYGERRYFIRGIDHSPNQKLKVNLKAVSTKKFHIDTLDLYAAKQRKTFAKEVELLFNQEPQVIENDLNRIIERTEEYIEKSTNLTTRPTIIPEDEREVALRFLKSPDLIQAILKDLETLGCAGEKDNLIMGYLTAVSRKLDDPLSLLILSRSAAGKSTLQDAILELVPEEDKSKYTRITGQALFYKGENSLQHKLIAIEEEEGANEASYSIRTMQSSKNLTIATTIKDPLTGQMKTQEYCVRGPLSIILTTSRSDIDYETMNRFIVLSIDESQEQTRLIHKIQRRQHTLAGLIKDSERELVIKKHHNSQRLLRPIKIVNPFAEHLTFADDRLRTRRDHKKYLNLIKAITFLHQYQRQIKTIEHRGQVIEYIEVTLEDIFFANALANEILGRSLDELTAPARELLKLITRLVNLTAEKQGILPQELRFTRRNIREYSKWSDWQIRAHLKELTDLEYVAVLSGKNGLSYQYQLIYDGKGEDGSRFLMGITDIATLRQKLGQQQPDLVSKNSHLEASLRPACGHLVRVGN